MEKISFSLELFFDHFYGQSFIKTVRGPLIFTGLLSADRIFPYIPDNECIRTSIGFLNQ